MAPHVKTLDLQNMEYFPRSSSGAYLEGSILWIVYGSGSLARKGHAFCEVKVNFIRELRIAPPKTERDSLENREAMGPQYRPQNTISLFMGLPKKYTYSWKIPL